MMPKFIGYVFIGVSFVLLFVAIYGYMQPNVLVFSPLQVLSATWYGYKKAYVEPDTFRTIDRQRENVTTSEGQSYTMLRAVWQADQTTFDGAWQWTEKNLAHEDDHLFSWLWGKREDGTYGVLTDESGQNAASDADTDIALALLFAYARWQDPAYLADARLIISDIWEREVITIQGKPYLAANDIEKNAVKRSIIVNPSYFNPAAYHIFAEVDTEHPWEELRAQSYAVLEESMTVPLDAASTAHLPPDWIVVDKRSGDMAALTSEGHDTHYGFDALRIPFRVALDAEWFRNPDALRVLDKLAFLSAKWQEEGRLASMYAHDGSVLTAEESPAMYGGAMGYFVTNDPEAAVSIYNKKLVSLYDPHIATWAMPLSYYADNWTWFGIALYNRQLPNLAAELPATAFSK